jgi:hypothetical protein
MGFDCTLHLIDEAAIRTEFVPKLLGRSHKKTPLDRVREGAAGLWEQARAALRGEPYVYGDEDDEPAVLGPEEAAQLVCQLAIMFAACSLPHHYERNLALSYWDEGPRGKRRPVLPGRFASDPEPLFAAAVAQYPALAGKFPRWFTSNYSTGVYVPAANVAEVRAWVEEKVGTYDRGEQRQFRGILRILRAAEQGGYAYWEATDLAVPMAGALPGDPDLMTADFLRNTGVSGPAAETFELPVRGIDRRGVVGDVHVLSDWGTGRFATVALDLSAWPPKPSVREGEFAVKADRADDGRWVLFSETDPDARPRTFVPRVYRSFTARRPEAEFRVEQDGKPQSFYSGGGFVGGRLVVFPGVTEANVATARPLVEDGDGLAPAKGFAAARRRLDSLKSLDKPVVGVARLADGAAVVVWDGDGYEPAGGGFRKTFRLGIDEGESLWTSAPAGGDGLFYLSNRRLFEARRGGEPVRHVRSLSNIMAIGPGPGGGLLLGEGDNKDGDTAKLYFPEDGTFAHLPPELFDDQDRYDFVAWSPGAGRVVASDGHKLIAVREEVVLRLPRYRVSTGDRVKE